MNNLVHYLKIGALAIILTILLTSCSKEEGPTGPTKEFTCDHITLTVNNFLPEDLDSITVGSQNFGLIAAGETEVLCLEESHAYMSSPDFLILFMNAIYEDEQVYDGYFCGTGLMPIVEGEFEIDITDVSDQFLIYEFK